VVALPILKLDQLAIMVVAELVQGQLHLDHMVLAILLLIIQPKVPVVSGIILWIGGIIVLPWQRIISQAQDYSRKNAKGTTKQLIVVGLGVVVMFPGQ
jgi:hypothetical protein